MGRLPVRYYVFDILRIAGKDVRGRAMLDLALKRWELHKAEDVRLVRMGHAAEVPPTHDDAPCGAGTV